MEHEMEWEITLIKSSKTTTKSIYNFQYPVSETFEGKWCKITAESQTNQLRET